MEACTALSVCMGTQMFAALTDPTPQPLLSAVLTSGGPGARRALRSNPPKQPSLTLTQPPKKKADRK